MLVLLDNAGDSQQVRPLPPSSPGCLVLVTSRSHLPGLVAIDGAHPIVLDSLSRMEAYELLSRRLGTGRVAHEPAAAEKIVAASAGLPLALAIVAGRAVAHPGLSLGRLADELADPARLDGFAYGDPAADIRAVFSWSYRNLDPAKAAVFRLLGLHPGPDVSVPAVASLAGALQHRLVPQPAGRSPVSARPLDLARNAWPRALEILEQLGHLDAEQIRARLRTVPARSA